MVQNSLRPKGAPSTRSFANGKTEQPSSPSHVTQRGDLANCIHTLTGKGKNHGTKFIRDMERIGEKEYVRDRDLPGLLHMFPGEVRSLESKSEGAILRKLSQALRAERRRGRADHYRYSLMRHIALMQAVAAEKSLRSGAPYPQSE
ncbi:DUF6477 family protein [uncultured Cohaesibacter sp.]|uniref:DUF6477 family protein n=1 Tax=uncultured Cohaesibacter sp. TaxID=1002546 RepID=UPI002AAB106B|nr:DUF6477 family protein [uncultured Cohaesibacter sp.]